jgi:hypothetical protein
VLDTIGASICTSVYQAILNAGDFPLTGEISRLMSLLQVIIPALGKFLVDAHAQNCALYEIQGDIER